MCLFGFFLKTGITSVAIDRGLDTVLVETTLRSEEVKDLIESTGKQAVIRGLGSSQCMFHFMCTSSL